MSYNHAFTFAVEVSGSNSEDATDVTGAQLRAALLDRINRLSDDDILEACEAPYDTFEEDDDE